MNTPPLIDQHSNHREQNGEPIRHVSRYTERGAERHPHAQVACMTLRDCRKGELPLVVLQQLNHPTYSYTDLTPDDADLTPDDADKLGDMLKQAAQRAREVTEALQARWGL